MSTIFGKKLGMTRIFEEDGSAVPVTVIEAGPCPVVALRTREKHGYNAYQLGFGQKPVRLISKPIQGHFKAAKVEPTRYLKEARVDEIGDVKIGDTLTVEMFHVGQKVDVCGVSRGLGFAGVMKRHHFKGGQATHGQSDRLRAPGSIGQSSTPSRTFKGMKMPGRMGGETISAIGLKVVRVIPEENLILIKGGVPGNSGGLLRIKTSTRR